MPLLPASPWAKASRKRSQRPACQCPPLWRQFVRLDHHRRLAGGMGVATVAMESTGVYWIPLFESNDCYQFHHKQIAECDKMIASELAKLPDRAGDKTFTPKRRKGGRKQNTLTFEAAGPLFKALGVDLTNIEGIDVATALVIWWRSASISAASRGRSTLPRDWGYAPGRTRATRRRLGLSFQYSVVYAAFPFNSHRVAATTPRTAS